jgi:phospholipid/cholesterol/gamma-HCH transport system substrate-binding protein
VKGQTRRTYIQFLLVFALIGTVGIAATIYTLVHQRLALPFQNTYTLHARFTAADGVISGLGQPVNVVGVKVGQVTGAELNGGSALVTMSISRGQVPHIYANASAVLQPITPLDDMEIALNPGSRSAGPMPAGATIGLGETTAPVQLSELLSTLDGDTRDYLSSLISSIGQGTQGRGTDLRDVLDTLGPTAHDAAQISQALAARRESLAKFVHNLALVTHAASQDRQLAAVVNAGDQTLHALAQQQGALRSAVAQLPATLHLADSTLTNLEPFAKEIGPTVTALSPSLMRLPAALRQLTPFTASAATALKKQIRPFVSAAQPLLRPLLPAVTDLNKTTPLLAQSFQSLEYLTNELAYNPNSGKDNQGFLFWLSWFAHNWNSMVGSGDANGAIGRGAPLFTCEGIQALPLLQPLLSLAKLCPK